jgi:hypothetical protein
MATFDRPAGRLRAAAIAALCLQQLIAAGGAAAHALCAWLLPQLYYCCSSAGHAVRGYLKAPFWPCEVAAYGRVVVAGIVLLSTHPASDMRTVGVAMLLGGVGALAHAMQHRPHQLPHGGHHAGHASPRGSSEVRLHLSKQVDLHFNCLVALTVLARIPAFPPPCLPSCVPAPISSKKPCLPQARTWPPGRARCICQGWLP